MIASSSWERQLECIFVVVRQSANYNPNRVLMIALKRKYSYVCVLIPNTPTYNKLWVVLGEPLTSIAPVFKRNISASVYPVELQECVSKNYFFQVRLFQLRIQSVYSILKKVNWSKYSYTTILNSTKRKWLISLWICLVIYSSWLHIGNLPTVQRHLENFNFKLYEEINNCNEIIVKFIISNPPVFYW